MLFPRFFASKSSSETIDYDAIRKTKLEEIGQILKQKRLDLDYSKELISNQVHIPITTINAIENADLTHLPEPVFIKQIIKKYANYLKINGEELSNNFPLENNQKVQKKHLKKSSNFKFNIQLSPKYLYLIYLFLILFSIKSLSNILEFREFQETKLPQTKIVETDSTKQNKQPQAIPAVEKKEEPVKSEPEELNLKLTVKQDAWVRIIVDGKPVYEGILNQGTEKEWIAKEKLTIRTGNAGGVMISLNEQKAKELGKLGQVEEVTFELPKRS
ncbi:helix-turn-helix domain-containing protein [Cyanobacterium sp. Dongsha4]|uniref:helix-turn-helix domain-containing protein n=1 Tax=Cyanobacterium sp. DS4 TaxID=2878255 RepID=UPI002E818911|nr:helix-turn-helix domain-containing protein [Cyanobacterium sp. Dongsha4]WVL01521.1 helix-turn-helix domain-containing protein [Cyanobacterium sp. Dongsha4]